MKKGWSAVSASIPSYSSFRFRPNCFGSSVTPWRTAHGNSRRTSAFEGWTTGRQWASEECRGELAGNPRLAKDALSGVSRVAPKCICGHERER
jgi:hypothetical protein